jgi:ribosomal protein S8E
MACQLHNACSVLSWCRPPLAGLRMKKAHVTHPELKATFCLDILGVKKNPNGPSYTQLGVVTKGTVIEARPLLHCPTHASAHALIC